MRRLCVDTCFLIGLCTERDQYYESATTQYEKLFERDRNRMVMPWPILYETLRTAKVKDRQGMRKLELCWKQLARWGLLDLVSDCKYREHVIQDCFDELQKDARRQRNLSATDRVIRNVLADRELHIDAMITSNRADFEDVCKLFNRELVPLLARQRLSSA